MILICNFSISSRSSLINNFVSANSTNQYLKSTTKSSHIPSTVNLDSSTASTDSDKANLFNPSILIFYSVFPNPSKLPDIDELPVIVDSLHAINITVADVYEALNIGNDDISPRVLQSCAEALCVL